MDFVNNHESATQIERKGCTYMIYRAFKNKSKNEIEIGLCKYGSK